MEWVLFNRKINSNVNKTLSMNSKINSFILSILTESLLKIVDFILIIDDFRRRRQMHLHIWFSKTKYSGLNQIFQSIFFLFYFWMIFHANWRGQLNSFMHQSRFKLSTSAFNWLVLDSMPSWRGTLNSLRIQSSICVMKLMQISLILKNNDKINKCTILVHSTELTVVPKRPTPQPYCLNYTVGNQLLTLFHWKFYRSLQCCCELLHQFHRSIRCCSYWWLNCCL